MSDREAQLSQSLKVLWVEYMGRDLTRWPERAQEFGSISAKAQQGELWNENDWACSRCSTMNLEAEDKCRKCGMSNQRRAQRAGYSEEWRTCPRCGAQYRGDSIGCSPCF